MQYKNYYDSPIGKILIISEEDAICGLYFEGQRNYPLFGDKYEEKDLPIINETKEWLDIYFSGSEPDFTPKIKLYGTGFQEDVWKMLLTVTYGSAVTYRELAEKIAEKNGIKCMSAQAIGNAVGKNKISLIVPCHRVVGAHSLGGYAGGVERKAYLLSLEVGGTVL